MRWFLGGLAVVLAVAGIAAPGQADMYDIQRAQRYLAEGDLRTALSWVDSAISSNPDYGAAYLLRASIWMRVGEYQKAVDDDSQAIAHGLDHSPYAYKIRGDARAAGGDYAAAIADYEQALKRNPSYWPALAGRGAARVESGDATGALADIDRLLTSAPSDLKETLGTRQVTQLSQKGPPARGTETLTITTPAKLVLAVTYQARGKLRFIQGAYQPALGDFDAALQQLPQLITAHFYHGLTLLALGRCPDGAAELHAPEMKAFQTLSAAPYRAFLAVHRDAIANAGCPAATF
jgi:tetratricopeptide (TPR) repeat protein